MINAERIETSESSLPLTSACIWSLSPQYQAAARIVLAAY